GLPPRFVSTEAFAPLSPIAGVSPKALVGPTATALSSWTRMPSRVSQKSRPSFAGSKVPLVSTLPPASSSITWSGGTRPPVPTTVAGGSGFPEERTVMDGEPESSVVVRFPVDEPPGRNSWTRPLTLSASPTLTVAAWTVTVHVSFAAKSVAGSSVNVVGPPLTDAVCPPLVPHEMSYQPSVTSTGSLSVIETLELTDTPFALFAGEVELTVGAWSAPQTLSGDAVLRGFGEPVTKSFALAFVSM